MEIEGRTQGQPASEGSLAYCDVMGRLRRTRRPAVIARMKVRLSTVTVSPNPVLVSPEAPINVPIFAYIELCSGKSLLKGLERSSKQGRPRKDDEGCRGAARKNGKGDDRPSSAPRQRSPCSKAGRGAENQTFEWSGHIGYGHSRK